MFTGIYEADIYYGEALLLGTQDYEGLQYRVYWEGDGRNFSGTGVIEPIAWPPTET